MTKSDLIRWACLAEAAAHKAGNVHPQASFADLDYHDFVVAANAVAPVLAKTTPDTIGTSILEAVRVTQERLPRPTNPNLGIVLLLAPLCAVPQAISLCDGIETVLSGLTVNDALAVYEAIRLANPGGMGKVDQADVDSEPTITLLEAMRLAADRDLIAAEYVSGFSKILQIGVPFLANCSDFEIHWHTAIQHLQLELMSHFPDSLILRKCGPDIAAVAQQRAMNVLQAGGLKAHNGKQLWHEFDIWLRADGHRRNPGTTADLIAASLFAAARDGMLPKLPSL